MNKSLENQRNQWEADCFIEAMKNKSRIQKTAILKATLIIFSKGEITNIEHNYIAKLSHNLFGTLNNNIMSDINYMTKNECLRIIEKLRSEPSTWLNNYATKNIKYFSSFITELVVLNTNYSKDRFFTACAIDQRTSPGLSFLNKYGMGLPIDEI